MHTNNALQNSSTDHHNTVGSVLNKVPNVVVHHENQSSSVVVEAATSASQSSSYPYNNGMDVVATPTFNTSRHVVSAIYHVVDEELPGLIQPAPTAPRHGHTYTMVTRSKAGVFKPKIYQLHGPQVPSSIQEALKDPAWHVVVMAEYKV
ncbi:hypothetical protein GQ457_12G012550 [Hibiscus cannabinus]